MLSIKGICDLISVCGKSGVTELSFDTLKVSFSHSKTLEENAPIVLSGRPEPENFEQIEQDLKEEHLSMALIENPAEYERLAAAGELEDDQGKKD